MNNTRTDDGGQFRAVARECGLAAEIVMRLPLSLAERDKLVILLRRAEHLLLDAYMEARSARLK
jgi:hypothetical protein